MAFHAKILADSCTIRGHRLTTFELKYPRVIHAEIMTHRMFSRNSASSRAIPAEKLIAAITNDPFVPEYWGMNQAGMQGGDEGTPEQIAAGKEAILKLHKQALECSQTLANIGFHKQIGNRYLEPWMWITVILSTTSFEHFRRLRNHEAAEPHFQKLARAMCEVYDSNLPKVLQPGEWHLPLTGFDGDESLPHGELIKLSTARCARVSYLTHEGKRDIHKDLELHDSLAKNGHWSPFEHPAMATDGNEWHGNFQGFLQYRKHFRNEFVTDLPTQTA